MGARREREKVLSNTSSNCRHNGSWSPLLRWVSLKLRGWKWQRHTIQPHEGDLLEGNPCKGSRKPVLKTTPQEKWGKHMGFLERKPPRWMKLQLSPPRSIPSSHLWPLVLKCLCQSRDATWSWILYLSYSLNTSKRSRAQRTWQPNKRLSETIQNAAQQSMMISDRPYKWSCFSIFI